MSKVTLSSHAKRFLRATSKTSATQADVDIISREISDISVKIASSGRFGSERKELVEIKTQLEKAKRKAIERVSNSSLVATWVSDKREENLKAAMPDSRRGSDSGNQSNGEPSELALRFLGKSAKGDKNTATKREVDSLKKEVAQVTEQIERTRQYSPERKALKALRGQLEIAEMKATQLLEEARELRQLEMKEKVKKEIEVNTKPPGWVEFTPDDLAMVKQNYQNRKDKKEAKNKEFEVARRKADKEAMREQYLNRPQVTR